MRVFFTRRHVRRSVDRHAGSFGSHTIKFETTFVKGDDNDVVRVFIDGTQKMRGGSWENYYRFD